MTEKILYVLGGLLLLMGVFGFLQSSLVAVLGLDNGHNSIHVVSGVVILLVTYFWKTRMKLFAKILGTLYFLLAVLGFFTLNNDSLMKTFNLNFAHTILHIVLAVLFLYFGFILKDKAQISSPIR